MRKTLVFGAMCLLIPALASADMLITYDYHATVDSKMTTPYSWVAVETFDDGTDDGGYVQSWAWSTVGAYTPGKITKGLTTSEGAPPAGDDTFYFCVPEIWGALPGASAVANFGSEMNYLGLYWGSIDTNPDDYNKIIFYDGSGEEIGSVSGSNVLGPDGVSGDQYGSGSNRYVNIQFLGGTTFTKVVFVGTQKAFEFDNLAVGVVPVPGAVLLGVLGLGAAGLRLRKRA